METKVRKIMDGLFQGNITIQEAMDILNLSEDEINKMIDRYEYTHTTDMLEDNRNLKNLLFVCEGNEQRSPTFEIWFKKNRPEYDVKSAGIFYYCPQRLTKELLEWADVVYVMELGQEMFIERKFPEFLGKVIVVGCGDDYQRESSRLFKLIEYWTKKNNL